MTTKTNTPRKPVGWINRFDQILSLKKCPPGENLPQQYRDDFKFIERTQLDIESLIRTTEIQVRKSTVTNNNVSSIAHSFQVDGYLHDKYPPIVIRRKEVINGKTVPLYELWIGNNRISAAEAVRWPKFMVDVYECSNQKALLTASCTTNHHKGIFKLMTKDDYLNVCMKAAYGTKNFQRVLGNGSNPTRGEIKTYTDEITGGMLKVSEQKYIVNKVWGARHIDNRSEGFQPYSLTSKGANSVEELATGNNQYAPKVKIPFKGNGAGTSIPQLGYAISDKGAGFRDNIPNAIRESVTYSRNVLFYIYIEETTKTPFSDSMIDEARSIALAKYYAQLNLFLEFAAGVSGVAKDELDKSRFKFVGFLPQKIGTDPRKQGAIKESTIVNVLGQPVDSLTGELLK